ncbi:hypothetical protein [Rossellomorea marisflavi]|uniref:hypothetical protein n=1 Tax=Rossellomorea marisflavi TaxID=189381 RepID=UPI0009A844B5|nr:hypothetical protein [Rossellomorea marisflavi]
MEILNTETVEVLGGLGVLFIAIGVVIAFLSAVVFFAALEHGEVLTALLALAVAIGGIMIITNLHDVGETKYEKLDVIVTDFNEIYDQGYEIVEQNGEIITIKKEGAGE